MPEPTCDAVTEAVARAITKAEGVDPEHVCYGVGLIVPKNERWPAWKVRVHVAKAAIEALAAETKVC